MATSDSSPEAQNMDVTSSKAPQAASHDSDSASQGSRADTMVLESNEESTGETTKKDWRFWVIITSLSVSTLLAALESTVVSTALPTIAGDLNAGDKYVWFINSWFLTSACFQPLFGQTADIFGRRWLTIGAVAVVLLGSGISGGANSAAMLIAGRAIQGIGGGGINVMLEIIICDILPLRERGKYMGIVFGVFAIGTSLGPVVGGLIVTNISWRWVFYINLPIGSVALILLILFLRVKYYREPWQAKIKRIDYVGNVLLVASIVSVLLALSWGGTLYPWSDYHVLVPLLLGLAGTAAFHVYEGTRWCKNPVVPPRLFANRTSAAALAIAFIHQMLTFWEIFFIPVYFQSVELRTPTLSGVDFLPTVVLAVPTAVFAGAALTKWGRYRPIHAVAFALATIGFGLFSLLDKDSDTAEWVIFQLIAAIGLGLLLTTTLAAVQADLPDKDVAVTSSTWSFMRSYGAIWGISIPAAIFNSRFSQLAAQRINNVDVLSKFSSGAAYAAISPSYVRTLSPELQDSIISAYTGSLRLVWYISLAFCGLGFLLVWVEKEIKLRESNEGEFNIEKKEMPTAEMDIEKHHS